MKPYFVLRIKNSKVLEVNMTSELIFNRSTATSIIHYINDIFLHSNQYITRKKNIKFKYRFTVDKRIHYKFV